MKLGNFFTIFTATIAAVRFSAKDQKEFDYKMDQRTSADDLDTQNPEKKKKLI